MDILKTTASIITIVSMVGTFGIFAFLFWIAWTQKPYDGGRIRIGETHEPTEQTPARSHYFVTRPAARLHDAAQAALTEPKPRALQVQNKK